MHPETAPPSAVGFKDVLIALKDRISDHNATIFAAAVAFFAFLALIPALTATIGIYGLVADANTITDQITRALAGAPESTRAFIVDQMSAIAEGDSGALGFSVGVGIGIALFSASGAVANLIKALNVAYELDETRKPWTLRGLALLLMVGGVVLLSIVVFLMAALPDVMAEVGLGRGTRTILNIVRFPVLAVVMAGALSLLYRIGPDHGGNDKPLPARLLTRGGVTATLLFVALSMLFSYYTANFGSYGETYGPLATIIVLLLWFQLSALAIIVGAELDAELADRAWRSRTGLEDPSARDADGASAARALFAAMAERDADAVLAHWHRRGVHHHPLFGDLAVPDELRSRLRGLFAAFPDLDVRVDEIHAAADGATVRYHLRGGFTGEPWCGVEPNGHTLDLDVVAVVRLDDGFVVEVDELFDSAVVVDQLGFRPGDRVPVARLKAGLTRVRDRFRRSNW